MYESNETFSTAEQIRLFFLQWKAELKLHIATYFLSTQVYCEIVKRATL